MNPPEFSNQAIGALARELHARLAGAQVKKIQELPESGYKFRLVHHKRDTDLILAPFFAFPANQSVPAKKQTTGFGAFLQKQLVHAHLAAIESLDHERILVFQFDTYLLYLECFGDSNVVLTDRQNKILGVEKKAEWKGRSLQKNAVYVPPPSTAMDPLALEIPLLQRALEKNPKRIVAALVQLVHTAGPLAEHACRINAIPPETPANDLQSPQVHALARTLHELYLVRPPKWGVVERPGQTILVSQPLCLENYHPLEIGIFAFLEKTFGVLPVPVTEKSPTPPDRYHEAQKRQRAALESIRIAAQEQRAIAAFIQTHAGRIEKIRHAVENQNDPPVLETGFHHTFFDAKKKLLIIETEK